MYQRIKHHSELFLFKKFPVLNLFIHKYKTGIKYIIAGSIAAFIQLSFLYILTHFIGFWYVTSTTIAFVFSFFTSFILQKFWTFRDSNLERMKKQFAIFIVLGVVNFLLNPILLYAIVEWINIWYMFAQVIVGILLAFGNFIINKFITFKKAIEENEAKL